MEIRNATMDDLPAIAAVEAACFPPAEAARRESFAWRIAQFPDRFFVACSAGRIIGLVNGCRSDRPQIDDTMFEAGAHVPDGPYQMIFGLAVLPEFRRRGVAAALLILGGGVGNIIDRIANGYVVDMFDLLLFDYPVFNLADCFVVVGVILGAVYYLWFYEKYDARKKDDATDADGDK